MSSILRALKKLESESSEPGEGQAPPQWIDTKTAVNKRVKGIWMTRRIATVLVAVILIGTAVFIFTRHEAFLGDRGPSRTVASAPVEEKIRHASTPMPQKTDKVTVPVGREERVPVEEKTRHASTPMPQKTDKVSVPAKREHRVPKAPENATEVKPDVPATSTPPIPDMAPDLPKGDRRFVSKTVEKLDPFLSAGGVPEPSKTPTPEAPVKEKSLETTGIKLEAIVWSRDPESRFAVINGSIVRIGGSYKGMQIKEIGRNHVALESGGRVGRLKFREQ